MSTVRVKKDARYFTASNEPFNDERLSWEARGLMGYLLSKPNDWEVKQKDIEARGTAGREKVRRMLAELRRTGYMNRIRVTLEHNKFDWITEVYESPSQNPSPSATFTKSQYTAFQSLVKPATGKAVDIVSTDLLSTEYVRYRALANKLATLQGGGLKTTDAPLMATWIEKHADEWIEKAIGMAQDKGARSSAYVDKILQGWEANGYPKTREQQVQERKGKPNATHQPNSPQPTEADLRLAAEIKAERALQRV